MHRGLSMIGAIVEAVLKSKQFVKDEETPGYRLEMDAELAGREG